ncbi:MAG TPA: BadF/BadG/BcrA/BcrD ATPase family protein [Candidatus Angelobacter sp.]
MSLFLGIDAGGTKTESAVSNGAELLGQATCASSKVSRVGEEEARRNLHQAILRACEAARVSPQAIDRVCIGMSGASPAGAMAWAERTIHELVPGQLKVMGDHIIAHQAAFGNLPGVLVIAGTGSIAYGRNERGETARAGGWGSAVSDEGSAFWIGREALAAALRQHDRGSNNGLLPLISELWQAGSPEEVLRIANSDAPARFAELAAAVSAAAERGDATAQTITTRAGKELAAVGGAVITRLWPPRAVVRVAMTGGVLQGSHLVRRAFQEAIQAEYSNVALSFAYVRPVLGALAIAAQPGALK